MTSIRYGIGQARNNEITNCQYELKKEKWNDTSLTVNFGLQVFQS